MVSDINYRDYMSGRQVFVLSQQKASIRDKQDGDVSLNLFGKR